MRSWDYSIKRALAKKLYRSIHLCRCNPDYKLKHPSEARLDPKNHNCSKVNVEAEKRIIHEHELHVKLNTAPTVIRPKRLNRSV